MNELNLEVGRAASDAGEYAMRMAIISSVPDRTKYKTAMKARRRTFNHEIRDNQIAIGSRIDKFDTFFESRGYQCPLPDQFERSLQNGLQSTSLFVDSLLYLEMVSGVLMGLQDRDLIEGDSLVLTHLAEDTTISSYRSYVECRSGEPVLIDGEGIVASVFQGPDRRTNLRPDTESLLFMIFDAPGIGDGFDEAVEAVSKLLVDAESEYSVQHATLRV